MINVKIYYQLLINLSVAYARPYTSTHSWQFSGGRSACRGGRARGPWRTPASAISCNENKGNVFPSLTSTHGNVLKWRRHWIVESAAVKKGGCVDSILLISPRGRHDGSIIAKELEDVIWGRFLLLCPPLSLRLMRPGTNKRSFEGPTSQRNSTRSTVHI